jgi:methyl-accepting chemotaxis protein
VRELSGRSEEAVKQTKRILHGVIDRVNRSADLNKEMTGRLKDVSRQVENVSAAMADIASASSQQNIGINQISAGVEQVNKVIQMNTEFAKQTAETADGLSINSEQLRDMVTIFTDAIHRLARQEAGADGRDRA